MVAPFHRAASSAGALALLLLMRAAPCSAQAGVANDAPADASNDVQVTRTACSLPHFSGSVVMRELPASCATACPTRRVLTLERADAERDAALFGVEDTYTFREDAPPTLSCAGGKLTLRWLEQSLGFELRRGAVQLSFAERRRLSGIWATPVKEAKAIEAREALARTLELVLEHVPEHTPLPGGIDRELVGLVELAATRDHLRAGDFQVAAERIGALEQAPRGSLPHGVALHLRELRQELDASRLRTLPFSLGARRLLGGAVHPLAGPTEPGSTPELFFRGAELCMVDVGPRSPAPPVNQAMHCFSPERAPEKSEPAVLPASSGEKLAARDFEMLSNHCRGIIVATQRSAPAGPHPCQGGPGVPAQDLLAVIDADAMLAVADGALELVRSPTMVQKVSPADARELVAASAGTRLFTRTASYFLERGLVAQVAGGEDKTWNVLGTPPAGTSWVGVPLVSPDQHWVVAQSGNGDGPVSLWVFAIQ